MIPYSLIPAILAAAALDSCIPPLKIIPKKCVKKMATELVFQAKYIHFGMPLPQLSGDPHIIPIWIHRHLFFPKLSAAKILPLPLCSMPANKAHLPCLTYQKSTLPAQAIGFGPAPPSPGTG